MSETLKNAFAHVGTATTTLYTCPASTTAIIQSITLANVDGTNAVDVDVYVTDDSAGDDYYIAKTVSVAADDTLVLPIRQVLEASDILKCSAGAASDADASASIIEVVT